MHISNFYEEVIVFGLLLFAVFGIYIMLKVHYHFAFGLMQNTASYEKHKRFIDNAKRYVFFTLKVFLWIGLIAITIFSVYYLSEGMSLKVLVVKWWAKIPDGFWIDALLVIIRVAVIIVVSRYILKIIYARLDMYQQKALENRCANCREETIIRVYSQLHTMLKYTVLLGILYRITLFFPFLEMISRTLWILLIMYMAISFVMLVRNVLAMIKEKRESI